MPEMPPELRPKRPEEESAQVATAYSEGFQSLPTITSTSVSS